MKIISQMFVEVHRKMIKYTKHKMDNEISENEHVSYVNPLAVEETGFTEDGNWREELVREMSFFEKRKKKNFFPVFLKVLKLLYFLVVTLLIVGK